MTGTVKFTHISKQIDADMRSKGKKQNTQDWKTNPTGMKTSQQREKTTRDQSGSAKQDNKPQVELITVGKRLVLVGLQEATGVLSKTKLELQVTNRVVDM